MFLAESQTRTAQNHKKAPVPDALSDEPGKQMIRAKLRLASLLSLTSIPQLSKIFRLKNGLLRSRGFVLWWAVLILQSAYLSTIILTP